MIPMSHIPREPITGLEPPVGNDRGSEVEFEQASQDCLIVVTPRRLAVYSAIAKVGYIVFLYIGLFVVLSGSRYLTEEGTTRILLMAQTNFWVVVILLAPLVLIVPLLSDLRLIIEGRRITFDKTRNVVLLNRRPLAALSDIAQVRIKSEHVKGGTRYHLIIEFHTRRAFELNESSDMVKLYYPAESIAGFLKVPFEEPDA